MQNHPGVDPPPFEANIVGHSDTALLLSQTYCYPRGGGQPGDTGIFSRSEGSMVRFHEVLSGEMILHPVDEPTDFVKGEKIVCKIDSDRRNSHAMMHTSQHIFSALAEDIWGAETVGNQIGAEFSRVDLLFEDKGNFDPDVLVDAVNSVLESSIDVNVHEWDRGTIMSNEQMRHTKFINRIPSSITHLRVVEVEGVDLCPCAGTHVSNTSDIPRVSYVGKKNKGKGRLRVSYQLNN